MQLAKSFIIQETFLTDSRKSIEKLNSFSMLFHFAFISHLFSLSLPPPLSFYLCNSLFYANNSSTFVIVIVVVVVVLSAQ